MDGSITLIASLGVLLLMSAFFRLQKLLLPHSTQLGSRMQLPVEVRRPLWYLS